jgi:signal transduction histidine kinase
MARIPSYPAPVDGIAVAQRVVNAMAVSTWQQSKVLVALEPAGGEIWIAVDAPRLEQALVNLLHHAIRHTPPGGMVILSLERQAGAAVVRLLHTAEGLPPGELPRIWDHPELGHSQAGDKPSLTRVMELVEAMGGNAAVESVPGEGICFTLTLPGES